MTALVRRGWPHDALPQPAPAPPWPGGPCAHPDVAALQEELAQARAEIAALREANGMLRHANTHDGLTGLLNREGLAEEWMYDVDGTDAVAMIDLDLFKEINDTLGHDAGDQVLAHVGCWLGRRYRIAARLGGDELVVVDNKHTIAAILDEPLSWVLPVAGTTVTVTATVGIARAGQRQKLAMARADAALIDAKRIARGSVLWWNPDRHPDLHRVEQVPVRPASRRRDTRAGAA